MGLGYTLAVRQIVAPSVLVRGAMNKKLVAGLLGVLFVVAWGCSEDSEGGASASTSSGGDGAAGGVGSAGGPATTAGTGGTGGAGGGVGGNTTGGGGIPLPTEIAECQGHVYECGDLLDNDNDGLVDSQDPDCLGPCDNTEDGLIGGIPGQSGPKCDVDCYFDQDSGAGNDDCYWSHTCDPNSVAPNYYPEPENGATCEYDPAKLVSQQTCAELDAAQSDQCEEVCGPLTPNGCDCFGCCELPAGTGKYVWLGSEDGAGNGSCTLGAVNDPTKCHPCEPVKACLNDCGYCELCIGKTSLPPDCLPGGGGGGGAGSGSGSGSGTGGGPNLNQCPDGVQPCGVPGQSPCPIDYYCVTGCCQKVPS